MKTIALTPRLDRQSGYDEVREAVDQRWGQWLAELGYQPLVLSHSLSAGALDELNLSGLLLTGGNDLASVSSCPLSEQRDHFEKQLLQEAMMNGLPILGVCRGMQFVADYFGCELQPITGHVASTHTLEVVPESLFYQELQQQPKVNSYHNYSVSSVCSELRVSAYSAEDHSIEAIEHKDYPLFGQMWHPERNLPANYADGLLLRRLFG